MRALLTIFERIDATHPANFRKRLVSVTSDSVTIGGHDSADVLLKTFTIPFLFEIKNDASSWWLVNPHRLPSLTVNGESVALERRLLQMDEILCDGHRIIFEAQESVAYLEKPRFLFQPKSDNELWDFLIQEVEFDEVLINGAKNIYVDLKGVLHESPWKFTSDEFLKSKIFERTQKNTGWASCRIDRTLRFQAALPPLVESPHISIRKAKRHVFSLDELEAQEFGSTAEIEFLRKALEEKQNILISGGTSTGKTVLMRSLIEKIPSRERIVVVEEETEVDWPHPHLVQIEAGRGNLRSALIECLRMRPDRLIVSEVRGAEAFEMLQALNTGHAGSMTTIHANSTREALSRLESLALSAGVPLTLGAVRRQIAYSINLIVHLQREIFGQRKIAQISRIGGIQNETILLSDPIGLEAIGLKQKISPSSPPKPLRSSPKR